MPDSRPTISTHVLDTSTGRPVGGLRVRLSSLSDEEGPRVVGEGVTDEDGRVRDLLGGSPLIAGAYRLEFGLEDGGFFSRLAVDLRIDDATRSHHVPLLRAPFGLSTYRGS